MRKVLLATGATLGLLLVFAAPAGAQTLPDITVDQRVPATGHAAPGSVHLVATENVDPALIGSTCDVNVNLANNQSIHPNSDLIITSGSSTVVALDVRTRRRRHHRHDARHHHPRSRHGHRLRATRSRRTVLGRVHDQLRVHTSPAAADDRPTDDGHTDHAHADAGELLCRGGGGRTADVPTCRKRRLGKHGYERTNPVAPARSRTPDRARRPDRRPAPRVSSPASVCSPEPDATDRGPSIDEQRRNATADSIRQICAPAPPYRHHDSHRQDERDHREKIESLYAVSPTNQNERPARGPILSTGHATATMEARLRAQCAAARYPSRLDTSEARPISDQFARSLQPAPIGSGFRSSSQRGPCER